MNWVSLLFAIWISCPAPLLAAQDAFLPTAPAQAQTQSAADQPMKYKPGVGIVQPKVVHAVDPKYSGKARRKKISGISVVSLTVGADGMPQNVKTVRSMADQLPANLHDAAVSLDENAVKAVRKYRFEPATLDGRPVPVEISVEVNYQLF